MVTYKPYLFTDIAHLSTALVSLTNQALKYGLSQQYSPKLRKINKVISILLHSNSDIKIIRFYSLSKNDLDYQDFCHCFFSHSNTKNKIVVSNSNKCIKHIVSHVLGFNEEMADREEKISTIEKGIYKFWQLKLMSLLCKDILQTKNQPVLIKSSSHTSSLEEVKNNEEEYIAVDIELKINEEQFIFRVLLPEDLFIPTPKFPKSTSSICPDTLPFSNMQIDISPKIAEMALANDDFCGLQEGDVIVFDNAGLLQNKGILCGNIRCLIGNENGAELVGSFLIDENNHYSLEYRSIDFTTRSTDNMSEENKSKPKPETTQKEANPNESVATKIMQQTQTKISIQLSQISLSLQELANLEEKQIIPLANKAKDPVRIVANSQDIGLGQLINVDGELAVKIISLIK